MRVAEASEHITHSLIGAKETIDFGITDDAAFFHLLSSTLYKNSTLAMVREVICNAWDAHIEAGKADTPIHVDITPDYFIVRDFGKAIPHDMIGPIYAIYGESTKKKDSRQTGGFGLGCKSPFSYTDHFEVTSCHEGTKTIYNMSRSSMKAEGKPQISTILSTKTEETGLTVKIPIRREDQNKLREYIYSVAFGGDIKVLLNGKENLRRLGLDESDVGFALVAFGSFEHQILRSVGHLWILIRYGNVVYPLEPSEEYSNLYQELKQYLHLIRRSIVIQAKPDSISIVPSREHLGMSDLTIRSVRSLLAGVLGTIKRHRREVYKTYPDFYSKIDELVDNEEPIQNKIKCEEWTIPNQFEINQNILTSDKNMALLNALLSFDDPRNGSINKKDWLHFQSYFLRKLVEKKKLDRGLTESWIHHAEKISMRACGRWINPLGSEAQNSHKWWRKRVLRPLVRKLSVVPDFDLQYLFYGRPGTDYAKPLENVKRFSGSHFTNNLAHLFKPTVVLCHNGKTLPGRLEEWRFTEGNDSNLVGSLSKGFYFAYIIPRRKKEKEAALEAFKKIQGIEFIDLTGRLKSEQLEYEKAKEEKAAKDKELMAKYGPDVNKVKQKKDGLVRLDQIYLKNSERIDTTMLRDDEDLERIENPEFVVLVSISDETSSYARLYGPVIMRWVAELYGKRGAVTNRQDTLDRYIKNGSKELKDFVAEELFKGGFIENDFKTMLTMSSDILKKHLNRYSSPMSDVIDVFFNNTHLKNFIPHYKEPSEEGRMKFELYKNFKTRLPNDIYKKVEEKRVLFETPQETKDFFFSFESNPIFHFLDWSHMRWLSISNRNKDEEIEKKVADFIIKTMDIKKS